MSRSRSRSLSKKRSPSPAIERKYSHDRSASRERSSRRRDKRLSKERDRTRYRTRSFTRSRSPRITTRARPSRSRSRNGRRRSSSRDSHVCPGDMRRTKYDNPEKSRCLGVFGLSESTTQYQIEKIFSEFGPIEQVRVVVDAKSRRSRGYCFVYFEQLDDAAAAKESCSNLTIDSRRVRVDYSITQRAHTPTPGIYKGHPIRRRHFRDRDDHRSYNRNSRPARYGRDRGYRRSRSHSPRDRRYR